MDREQIETAIRAAAMPLTSERGLELVDVKIGRRGRDSHILVTIDKPDRVTAGDCEWFSERLSFELDAIDPFPGRYYLEVSSPGVDRPISTPEHFARFTGYRVSILTGERRRIHGRITSADSARFTVATEPRGEPETIEFANVVSAQLAPGLDELLKRTPKPKRSR